MAEVEVDQSSLPRVQEVCQNFAVLEDGVLAHSLQEQEIEQYYTTNVQKSQLVQNDIRVAKELQDEEERRRAAQRALLRQTSRQIEEQDFQYARVIQEEIQQRAEEARRRERHDEEIAKRLQEEEEELVSSDGSGGGGGPQDHARASLGAEPGRTNLDLGELQQVLQDEELARQLQEEEERELRRNSHPPTPRSFPVGDFRLAQVAQDEEIARFMQKQEIKSKRGLRELDGPGSWREHRAMMSHQDRAVIAPSQSARAERRDSEGPSSPTEGCSLDQLPPTPTSTVTPSQPIRNIAEELDPTFQARRRSTDRTEETGTTCCSPPMAHTDFLHEPTFIPPTKRQADQAGRSKPKEKRENCKQQ
ncbi:coiled-coil domain-containing protein 187 isoform X4 [Synchiropus splendidus]|uniref:coiled-coil domain-containing protein 187 isoform X4 n=1 Tax=Synchiropus splendidus TaxID=270530 RepID=UPI00237E59BF|nr:coiled-coil domain-containing protein 187 isoform X4 [Synchiropus splendidus]